MASSLPKLPVDIATFRVLREENYLYVDKTQHAYNLIRGGRRCVPLSRKHCHLI